MILKEKLDKINFRTKQVMDKERLLDMKYQSILLSEQKLEKDKIVLEDEYIKIDKIKIEYQEDCELLFREKESF